MKLHVDKEADALYLRLDDSTIVESEEVSPGKAKQVKLVKDFYFEKGPMAISGLADGAASETGCVWLQVTNAKGTSIPNVSIEEPVYI